MVKSEGMRIALDSLGCKLNQAEVEFLSRQLAEAGYRLVSPHGKADVYILNTCTVTHIADSKSRHWLRLAHRRNPNARLVATGCYAQRAPWELARIEGVSLVLGNGEKSRLLLRLDEGGYLTHPLPRLGEGARNGSRIRALLKIQDGCSSPCSFCIVPRVRGRGESRPVESVVADVRQRVAEGSREVVLTGTEIGSYHNNGADLSGLLWYILDETDVFRLRLSSLQPQEVYPELIGLWRDGRLCRHFHLSLQSGSDRVLGRMQRRYSVGDYQQSISLIRSLVPQVAITTDVIIGFPGETDAEFQESYELCQRLGFARIHVFTYSPRAGTPASRMPDQVSNRVKKERSRRMLALAGESAQNFSCQFLGESMTVLWEKQTGGIWSGLTDNYLRVYTRSSGDLTNRLLPVRLLRIYGDGVWGEL